MKIANYSRFRFLFAAMAAVALVLAVIGIADISSTPYSGYLISTDYRIIRVAPDSPAAMAGMQVGDSIIEIAGIATGKLYKLSKQLRPGIGEYQKIAVLRGQEGHELTLRQVALPFKEWFLAWGKNLVGVIMVAVGLTIYWSRDRKSVV
jgi:membrane-associated protease RseP (regulator of RpoE activity)